MTYQFDDYEITISKEKEENEVFFIAKIDELEAYGEGETREAAIQDLELTFEDILKISKADGLKVSPPIKRKFSGHLSLRIPKYLHERLFGIAKKEGVSLNQLIASALSLFAGREEVQKSKTVYNINIEMKHDGLSAFSNSYQESGASLGESLNKTFGGLYERYSYSVKEA
ncbi:toxin-antitoxin system HicB family antitoxin [Pseudoramibacter alactolyticus]|uniref:toxin-antitoxin system HicB family antitoxin n=1 Tax=Pseudoramibacter alactolyticus TaxID=113287 RepID=UPI0028EC6C00|nr:toxin-antitoxin system HicB family antitoxin [Pseudoramibacter alactolyticus]